MLVLQYSATTLDWFEIDRKCRQKVYCQEAATVHHLHFSGNTPWASATSTKHRYQAVDGYLLNRAPVYPLTVKGYNTDRKIIDAGISRPHKNDIRFWKKVKNATYETVYVIVCRSFVGVYGLQWNPKKTRNLSGDEITNVNFLRRYRTRTSKYQKEPTSFNKLNDCYPSTAH